MIVGASLLDWRVGRTRLLLPSAIHLLCATAAINLSLDRWFAWLLVFGVLVSAIYEFVSWFAERGVRHALELSPGGIAIDGLANLALRAWLGPGWTAIWLIDSNRRRRLLYVIRDEVTQRDHAALRRHVSAFDFI